MENTDVMDVTTQQNDTQNTIDYKVEYEKMLAERDSFKAEAEKQKGLKDKYASENADYKKKEIDKMSDDEKKAKEYQDLLESNQQMKAELEAIKLEKEIMAEGFTAEECAKLMESNRSPKVIAEIIKAKVEAGIKSINATLIKESTPTPLMGKGSSTDGTEKSAFQLRQESRQKNNKTVEL